MGVLKVKSVVFKSIVLEFEVTVVAASSLFSLLYLIFSFFLPPKTLTDVIPQVYGLNHTRFHPLIKLARMVC